MLVPRVFVKNLRLTQRLIDDFLANALGTMMNASCIIRVKTITIQISIMDNNLIIHDSLVVQYFLF